MARVADYMTPEASLPKDGTAGALAARVWRPDVEGPSVAAVRGDGVYDISRLAPTMRDLCRGPRCRGDREAGQGRAYRHAGRHSRQHAGGAARCQASRG